MSFGSWEFYESLAAGYLFHGNDPNKLTFKELKDEWGEAPDGRGPCCLFMMSHGLKPWNHEDIEEAVAISKALKEGRRENNDSTGLRDDEKMTDSEVHDGAGKLIPNDVEKAEVKDSQMEDTNSLEVQKLENTGKKSTKSLTESNVDDYSSLCWSCSKTKTEVKLYTCAGCKKAKYCGRVCIEHDWPHHKNWCLKTQKKKEIKKLNAILT